MGRLLDIARQAADERTPIASTKVEAKRNRVQFSAADGSDVLLDPNAEARRQRVAPEVELTALVNLIADYNGFTPEDRQQALEIALADALSALECFRALAAQIPTERTWKAS